MNNNLGRCDAKQVLYDARNGTVTFTQESTGKEIKLKVIQNRFNITTQEINSTVYQWGRKDPFVGVINCSKLAAKTETSPTYKTCYPLNGQYIVPNHSPEDKKNGIGMIEAIQTPYKPVKKGSADGWMGSVDQFAWNILSGQESNSGKKSEKSIFDPCPVGFKVPNYSVFKIFSAVFDESGNGNHTIEINKDDANKYEKEDGIEFINKYLNGFVGIKDNNNKIVISDFRSYTFYTKKDKKGQELQMISTGRRPVSGTEGNYNNLILWTSGIESSTSSQAYLFKVGYDGGYKLTVKGTSNQAGMYPIRLIKE